MTKEDGLVCFGEAKERSIDNWIPDQVRDDGTSVERVWDDRWWIMRQAIAISATLLIPVQNLPLL